MTEAEKIIEGKKLLVLINAERVRQLRNPLAWDEGLWRVGRDHSDDMLRRRYFGHVSPDGQKVQHRVAALGLNNNYVGENLVLASDIQNAVVQWMHSAAHHSAIMNNLFRNTGIGIAVTVGGEIFPSDPEPVPEGWLLITQVFSA